MTIALHRPRPLPLNHSAYRCTGCDAPSLTEHTRGCRETSRRRPGLAFPDAARVFAGLLIGLPIGAALWAIGALIVWSLA